MKNLAVEFKIPAVLLSVNNNILPVTSMVLSTVMTCALITFVPQLMPLWMQLASTPSK